VTPLAPGARIGVLGGGQLGRMFGMAACRLGYRVHVLDADPAAPAATLAERLVRAELDDLDAVAELAAGVDVVTFEFENVPLAAAAAAARHAPVRPGPDLLAVAQHRAREKRFLAALGIPLARWAEVADPGDLQAARRLVPGAALLKTSTSGYDGRGQRRIAAGEPLDAAWHALGAREAVLEQQVDLAGECSVLVARGASGASECFGPIANRHQGGILDCSSWPARLPRGLASRAREASRAVAEALGLVGVLCVEWFVTQAGELLANEIAPRPHNSGHLSIEACTTSQFEQQVRTVCGLPLGSFDGIRPAAMANLLGELWRDGSPDWARALGDPAVRLHLYGKREPRPGRKMGHLTALAPDARCAEQRVRAARRRLQRSLSPAGPQGMTRRATALALSLEAPPAQAEAPAESSGGRGAAGWPRSAE
jgi:5-(carboxyamino)imidazole ribonucleotide synthase